VRLELTENWDGARIAQAASANRQRGRNRHFSPSHFKIAMPEHALYRGPSRARLVLAFAVSSAVHLGVLFVFVAPLLDRAPRGAVNTSTGSSGMMLRVANAGQNVGESVVFTETSRPAMSLEPVEAPPLLTAELIESPPKESARSTITLVQATVPKTDNTKRRPQGGSGKSTGLPGGTPNGGSGYAKTSVFGVPGTGNKFVYVFDRSSSMEGAPLAAAKRQLIESLKSLESVHQFHIIFFNQRLTSLEIAGSRGRIPFATDRNKQLASNFVGGITADGGTNRVVALKQALTLQPDVIFFLTDADDPMSAGELADIARINERVGATISTIEFGRSGAPLERNFLKVLAEQSGGKYGFVDTAQLKP
jgi:hypothetical protein